MAELRDQLQKTLGDNYTLERELGGGGMSRVFVAVEESLGRQVVVKVLPTEMAGQVSIERFKREIRLAASLQQANIVPVLSAGDAGEVAYYTMPFVRGESLRARLAAKSALPIAECVAILRDVARALAFAHAEGVVHRDIKPENILLSGGTAVVTDFGIAKAIAASSTPAVAPTLTQMGLALGTPAYMAPEQAVGEEVDHRADLYSLGVVAYEMLTGASPFAGRSPQGMLAAHAIEAPEPIARKRPDVPPRLASLVARCLAKEQRERPQSATAVLEELEAATTPGGAVIRTGIDAAPTVAVLPFANASADPDLEFLSDGISEEILNALGRLKGLRVIGRTSSFAFKGKKADVRDIGRSLGATLILDGSVRKASNKLRISAQLIDAADGLQLWSDRYDREMTDIFDIQDDITTSIHDALRAQLLGADSAAPQGLRNIDPETYELFLRGRYFLNRPPEGMQKGMDLLRRVAERAPDYAPAQLELASAYNLLASFGVLDNHDARPKARELACRALAVDSRNGRAHLELGIISFHYDYDFDAARRHLERAIALAPDDAWVSGMSMFFYSAVGEHREATRLTRRAVSADPLNPLMLYLDQWPHYFAREWEEVIARSDRVADLDPNYSEAYRLRAHALLQLGRHTEARRAAERTVELSGRHPYQLNALAIVLARTGEMERARSIVHEMIARSRSESGSIIAIATAQLALGDVDSFFETMEQYYHSRGHWLSMLRAEPLFDPARRDPRFLDLVRRVGIPEWRDVPSASMAPPVPRKPAIGVLPLSNMSASADDEYFSDGITEDIIAQLSQIASLKVISRTSVMRYKKTEKSAKEIAVELGVSHIVEGSVRRAGQRLRIVAQLIDAQTDEHLWSCTFDREMTDVFAVQNEVAERIADALRTKLAPEERARIARKPTEDQEAYDLFLLARHHLNLSTADGFTRAMDFYQRAVARDPRFARAWGALARAHHFHLAGYYGVRPRDVAPKVIDYASRALELDPGVAEAHMMLGYVDEFIHHDLDAQRRKKERAVALSPNFADAHLAYGNYLVAAGRYEDAVEEARVALELDPASELVHLHANWLRYLTRHFDEALAGLEAAEAQFGLKLLPLVHGEALLAVGREAEAVRVLSALCQVAPITLNLSVRTWCLAAAGRAREAREQLQDLHSRAAHEYVWPVPIAATYACLGEMDTAFEHLTRCYDDRVSWVHLPFSPTFDRFRGDPRFEDIAKKVGAVAPSLTHRV